jgi:transposase
VSRQGVHAWLRRYEQGGLGALADRPRRPGTCPHQTSAQAEAAVCEMLREHPKWGPLRLAHELGKAGVNPAPSRMSVYRVLVRHGLVEPGPRKRPKDSYLQWERDEPMALWQLGIVGGAFLADGTEAKVVTGVDDYSRYCVIAAVAARATGRAVCLAFAGVGMRGPVGRHCGGFAVSGRLELASLNQQFPAGRDVLLIKALDDIRVHLSMQTERGGAFPGPLPRRFPGRGVVRHGPGAARRGPGRG